MTEPTLDPVPDDCVRLTCDDARGLAGRALRRLGLDDEEAGIVAAHLVDAAAWGYAFAGLPRVVVMADRPELRQPRRPVAVVKESPVSALIDGGNHTGYFTLLRAVDIAIDKVRTSGIALVGVHNSWFSGRNAFYLERIARAGYAVIYVASSTPTVVPPGATRKALGTNPIAIALPGQPDPFIHDIGTAAVMSGEMLMRAFLGESFPEVVGIDGKGAPTRVARDLLEGGVHPFGGYKGYGLSVAIQALGLIAGARLRNGDVCDFAHLFVAFDPELFMPLDRFTGELEELLSRIRNLPRQPGVDEIRIPSERGFREREIRRRQGIVVKKRVVERLQEIA
jgi:LDH2 family malate/lactate/ureidoglycolate dehydrogenase